MFRGLMKDAKSAVGSVIEHYAMRAAVVSVLILAMGFATAAIAIWLAELYGIIYACWILAGVFALLGLLAAAALNFQNERSALDEKAAVAGDTAEVSAEAATQAAIQLPMALLGSVLTTPLGPATTLGLLKLVVRNLPLILLLGVMALLLSSRATPSDAAAEAGRGSTEFPT